MAGAFVANRGTGSASSTAATLAVSTTGTIAAGAKIVVTVICDGFDVSSISGGGLTWTVDKQSKLNGASQDVTVAVCSADAPAGLASGTSLTLTVSSAASTRRGMSIDEYSGLATGAPAAGQAAANSASAAVLSTGATANSGAVGDVAVAAFGTYATANPTWSTTDGGTGGSSVNAGISFIRSLFPEYRVLAGAGAVTASSSRTGSSSNYVGAVVVYPQLVVTPPANTVAPALSTTSAVVGTPITCSTGSWSGTPTSYAYAWYRDGVAIGGAITSSYTPTISDVGHVLTCQVIATNAGGSSSPATSNATASVPNPGVAAPSTPQGAWKVILCDKFGEAISDVSPIALDKQLVCELNKPSSFSFRVPANDARVAGLNTGGSLDNLGDGLPFLHEFHTVRAYRYELQADGSHAWTIRFAGHVWLIEDTGDANGAVWSHVTAFDPLMMLNFRVARRMIWVSNFLISPVVKPYMGQVYPSDSAHFTFNLYDDLAAQDPMKGRGSGSAIVTVSGTDVARGLLNMTNLWDGFTGLDDYYKHWFFNQYVRFPDAVPQFALGGDQRPPSSTKVSPLYDNKIVGEALTDLVNMNDAFDLEVVPTDGYYGTGYFGAGRARDYTNDQYLPNVAGLHDYSGIPSSSSGLQGWPTGPLGQGTNRRDTTGPVISGTHYPTSPLYQTLGLLKFYVPNRGTDKTATLKLGYGCAPYNVKTISRSLDKTTMVNNIRVIGKARTVKSQRIDSMNAAGHVFMATPPHVEIKNLTQLNATAAEILRNGQGAAQTLSIELQPGRAPLPFDDFNIGDTLSLAAGSALRGGFSTTVRVYGFTLDIRNESGAEVVSQIVTSPQTF